MFFNHLFSAGIHGVIHYLPTINKTYLCQFYVLKITIAIALSLNPYRHSYRWLIHFVVVTTVVKNANNGKIPAHYRSIYNLKKDYRKINSSRRKWFWNIAQQNQSLVLCRDCYQENKSLDVRLHGKGTELVSGTQSFDSRLKNVSAEKFLIV